MIEKQVNQVLDELDSFFNVVLKLAENFERVSELAEWERDDLISYTIDQIDSELKDTISVAVDQLAFLKLLQTRLENYFSLGDVINSIFRNNIKTYCRSQIKYRHSEYVNEITKLLDSFKDEVSGDAKKIHCQVIQDLNDENFKLANITLPYTGINELEFDKIARSISENNKLKQFIACALDPDWKQTAPDDIRPYLDKVLEYDIGCIKSSILWEILGHVLLKIDDLEKSSLRFADLFTSATDYEYITALFKKNAIIKSDGLSMGIVVPGSIERHTVASLIAVAEVLTERKFLKQEYTRTEQVRIMARTFNMKASRASLTKTSPFHNSMIEKLNEVLN